MAAIEDEFAALVVDGAAQADDAGGAAGGELIHFQGGVEGVSGEDGGEEAGGLFEEGLEGFFYHVGEEAGAGGGLDGDLVAVGEEIGEAVAAAEFTVVVDGVVVAGGGLEGEEDRLCHGAAGEGEAFAYGEILEPALLGDEAVLGGVELGHGRLQCANRRVERAAGDGGLAKGSAAASGVVVALVFAPGPGGCGRGQGGEEKGDTCLGAEEHGARRSGWRRAWEVGRVGKERILATHSS